MRVVLKNRTEADVRIYYEKAQQPDIKALLPQEAKSVEEALAAYRKTRLPGSTSWGHKFTLTTSMSEIYGATALTGRKHRMQC